MASKKDQAEVAAKESAPSVDKGAGPVVVERAARLWGMTAGLGACVGSVLAAAAIGFGVVPQLIVGYGGFSWTVITVLGVISLILFVVSVVCLDKGLTLASKGVGDLVSPEADRQLYSTHLVGVGAALLILAITSVVIMAGLAWTQALSQPSEAEPQAQVAHFAGADAETGAEETAEEDAAIQQTPSVPISIFGKSPEQAGLAAFVLGLAALMSVLGAMFFFATSLWAKLKADPIEPFRERVFWAGMWYRIGEAVLFGVVLFLVLLSFAEEHLLLLPLASLLVGMFLKPGERLINGIAMRLFAMFDQLVPMSLKPEPDLHLEQLRIENLSQDGALTPEAQAAVETLSELTGVLRVRSELSSSSLLILRDRALVSLRTLVTVARSEGLVLAA